MDAANFEQSRYKYGAPDTYYWNWFISANSANILIIDMADVQTEFRENDYNVIKLQFL